MPVFDLHCDTLTAFMSPLRCRDTLNDPCSAFALSKVQTIPWCQCCAVFVPDGLTPQEALSYYRYHRDSFQRQVQGCQGQALACTTAREVSAAWEQGKTALVLTVENGSLLGAGLEHVEELRRDGVRMLTLTWNGENALGSGHETDHGLTPLGKEAVRALEETGYRWWTCPTSTTPDSGTCWTLPSGLLPPPTHARAVCAHRRNPGGLGKSKRW